MSGFNEDEGSLLSLLFDPTLPVSKVDRQRFKRFINILNQVLCSLDANRVTNFYLNNVNPNDSNAIRWRIYDFFGDLINKCPTYKFAKLYAEHTNRSKVFFYQLTYSPKAKNPLKQNIFDFTDTNLGVFHGLELAFIFGVPLLMPEDYDENDIRMSRQFMKHWTNFAKYGYLLNSIQF